MKKQLSWQFYVTFLLILGSVTVYMIHYFIFKDTHHIFIYLVGDIAFVFIEVLLVSIIIHQLLNEWEKKSHLKKINMVIETFFSEFGKQLLAFFSSHDKNRGIIQELIAFNNNYGEINFKKVLNE